jgi:copper chaperone CopZ
MSGGTTTATAGATDLESLRFPVRGMTCSSCVNRITRSLKKVDGISRIRVDLGDETATITRTRGHASDADVAAAVAAAGYEADLSAAAVVPTDTRTGLLHRLLGR